MKNVFRAAALAGCLAWVFPAQEVAGVVTQTAPGTLTLTITASQNGITLQTACTFTTVRLYSPTGPVIVALPCAAVLVPVAPCATRSQAFTPSTVLYDTLYYFEVDYYDSAFVHHVDFIPGAFDGPGGSTFVATTPAQIGTVLVMQLSDATFPGAAYAIGLSETTNVGITLSATQFISLDQDGIFALAFPTPDPAYFTGFQGTLDATGSATGTIAIPYVPALACRSLHAQAVVLAGGTIGSISLPLGFAILP